MPPLRLHPWGPDSRQPEADPGSIVNVAATPTKVEARLHTLLARPGSPTLVAPLPTGVDVLVLGCLVALGHLLTNPTLGRRQELRTVLTRRRGNAAVIPRVRGRRTKGFPPAPLNSY